MVPTRDRVNGPTAQPLYTPREMIFLDAGGPVLFAAFGAAAFTAAILVAIPLEALLLRLLKWASIGRCFLDSLIMNAVSTLLGVVLVVVAGGVGIAVFAEGDPADLWLVLAVAFALTVISEALVLMISRRGSGWRAWVAGLVVNVASYAVIAVLAVLLGRALES